MGLESNRVCEFSACAADVTSPRSFRSLEAETRFDRGEAVKPGISLQRARFETFCRTCRYLADGGMPGTALDDLERALKKGMYPSYRNELRDEMRERVDTAGKRPVAVLFNGKVSGIDVTSAPPDLRRSFGAEAGTGHSVPASRPSRHQVFPVYAFAA